MPSLTTASSGASSSGRGSFSHFWLSLGTRLGCRCFLCPCLCVKFWCGVLIWPSSLSYPKRQAPFHQQKVLRADTAIVARARLCDIQPLPGQFPRDRSFVTAQCFSNNDTVFDNRIEAVQIIPQRTDRRLAVGVDALNLHGRCVALSV